MCISKVPGHRVLIVDDNAVNRRVAAGLLKSLGIESDPAENGAQALVALASQDYSLVFMDCQMPELDGYETTRRIRKDTSPVRNPRIPVIALTASAAQTDRERCLQAGMSDFISKPIIIDRLRELVQTWLFEAPAEHSTVARACAEADRKLLAHAADGYAELPVFESAKVRQRLMGDPRLIREMIGVFLEDMKQQLGCLQLLLDEDDLSAATARAHQIKGAAATMLAMRLSHCAGQMEALGRSGDLKSMRARMLEMEHHLAQLNAAMQKFLQTEISA